MRFFLSWKFILRFDSNCVKHISYEVFGNVSSEISISPIVSALLSHEVDSSLHIYKIKQMLCNFKYFIIFLRDYEFMFSIQNVCFGTRYLFIYFISDKGLFFPYQVFQGNVFCLDI